MKITVFNGSPKGAQGNTQIMVAEFLKGAEEAGAQTENIFLVQKKIHHCVGCYTCWLKTPGVCIHHDDMSELFRKFEGTDIVVFACPVYVGDVTGIMKNFIDRLIVNTDPHMEIAPNGITRHKTGGHKPLDVVLISNCGFPEQIHFDYFKNTFKYLEMNGAISIIAEIFRGEGGLLAAQDPQLLSIVDQYKTLLRQAGREVVKNRKLSDETMTELEKPLIPYENYIMGANMYFDQVLAAR